MADLFHVVCVYVCAFPCMFLNAPKKSAFYRKAPRTVSRLEQSEFSFSFIAGLEPNWWFGGFPLPSKKKKKTVQLPEPSLTPPFKG